MRGTGHRSWGRKVGVQAAKSQLSLEMSASMPIFLGSDHTLCDSRKPCSVKNDLRAVDGIQWSLGLILSHLWVTPS